jgi:hypothetical protein
MSDSEMSPASKTSDVHRLVMRFEKMAEVREKHAAEKRFSGDDNGETARVLESAASAYRRCAEEARRVADGETPPEAGYRWD